MEGRCMWSALRAFNISPIWSSAFSAACVGRQCCSMTSGELSSSSSSSSSLLLRGSSSSLSSLSSLSSMSSSSSSSSPRGSPRASPTPCSGSSTHQLLCPFIHQVGGHFPMVCLDERTLCKPLNEREHAFYSSMPSLLRPFVPLFHGVMVIEALEDSEGYIVLRGTPPRHYRRGVIEKGPKAQHYRLIHRDSIELEAVDPSEVAFNHSKENKMCEESSNHSTSSHENVLVINGISALPNDFYNPWALKCHRDHLKKSGLIRDSSNLDSEGTRTRSRAQKYLLLENLVAKFENPCILDLKVGMRQYSDEVSEEKKRRKMLKSSSTTSCSLGLRLSGMQVFNRSSESYICHNKYFGRTLNEASFKQTLKEFLSPNGHSVELSLVEAFLEKAHELRDVVAHLDSFRFYTCSLLLTFDGSMYSDEKNRNDVNLRVIDFAHATHREMRDSKLLYEGPDEGFIAGLSHLLTLLKHLQSELLEQSTRTRS